MVRMQPLPPLPHMHLSASVPVPPPSGANSRMKPPVCPNIRSCGASTSLAERATSSTARLNLLLSCFRLAVWLLLSRTATSPCRPHPPPTARCGPRGQCGRFTHLHDPVTGLLWPPAANKGLQGSCKRRKLGNGNDAVMRTDPDVAVRLRQCERIANDFDCGSPHLGFTTTQQYVFYMKK